ncbi:MAG: FAD-binding protein [Devosia sp.]|nr:FAD-binding protein [Devosia sp.]
MTMQCDLLIAGAGAAGLAAAARAVELGANVVLIEKTAAIGGATQYSASFVTFAGTEHQERLGYPDNGDILYDDLVRSSNGTGDPELLRAYVENQLDVYHWLVKKGVVFKDVVHFPYQTWPRAHHTEPMPMLETLLRDAQASGKLKVLFDCAATRPLVENGRVVGLEVLSGDQKQDIRATKGVVLATGGFGWGEDFVSTFVPNALKGVRFGHRGNTGDGLRICMSLGADMRDMGFVKGTFASHPVVGPERHEMVHAYYDGAIVVNKLARRFMDESLSYKLNLDYALLQPDHIGYQILDAKVFAKGLPGVSTNDYEDYHRRGKMTRHETLEELASAYDLDPVELRRTIETYNSDLAEFGYDRSWGRAHAVTGSGEVTPIDTAPYYVFPTVQVFASTFAGIRIDSKTRVVNVYGEPVQGLYAVGEMTGGFHGHGYMTGTSVGKSLVFGYIAAETLAGDIS